MLNPATTYRLFTYFCIYLNIIFLLLTQGLPMVEISSTMVTYCKVIWTFSG